MGAATTLAGDHGAVRSHGGAAVADEPHARMVVAHRPETERAARQYDNGNYRRDQGAFFHHITTQATG